MPDPAADAISSRAFLRQLLGHLHEIDSQTANRLAKLGLQTVQDAVFYFPRNYEYPAPPTPLNQLRDGVDAAVVGTITEMDLRTTGDGRCIVGALVEAGQDAVRLLFFNQVFWLEKLARGMRVMVSGRPRLSGLRMEFVHPQVTILSEDDELPCGSILPVYGLTEGLKQALMRRLIPPLVRKAAPLIREVLPPSLRQAAGERLQTSALLPIDQALCHLHQPTDDPSLQQARRRFVFQELLVLQLALALQRRRLTTELTAPAMPANNEIDSRIHRRFGFTLTGDQQRVISEVAADMGRQYPMNRLIQGDVGSGKTVIAQYAMLLTVAHGHQAMLMAPTEILARQHHNTLSSALAGSRVRLGLLTGSLPAPQRRQILDRFAAGEVDVLVGTQALLYGQVVPAKLGLVVIDEQHKFGVGQRAMLRRGGLDPHSLVLSATPIPRTLAMTLFGDLDISTLREKPPGRKPVRTYLAVKQWRARWWEFVRQHLSEGRQAYVVTPRVVAAPAAMQNSTTLAIDGEDSAEQVSNAQQVFAELTAGPLQGFRVDLLHGRLPAEAKHEVMQRFAQRRCHVLVCTTVIEVGIDVPNATVMTILGGEHFGLAQLHQLRGRVARGTVGGHVCVFTDRDGDPEENERLQIFAQTSDGFELAEADFRLRGPGDLLGTRQSGLPPMRIADLQRDQTILTVARELAQELIDADPLLEAAEYEQLKKQVLRRYGEVLELGDVA